MNELVATIQSVLNDADLVLGWTRNEKTGVAEPARFYTAADAGAAVFDSTCVHNLAVYLPRLKDRTAGIVAKGCDARAIVQLIVEREVERERVRIIGVPCPGMLDVKKLWRGVGFGCKLTDAEGRVTVEQTTIPREDVLLAKCRGCRDLVPVLYDEAAGDLDNPKVPPPAEPAELEQRFAAMTPAQRREFWEEQFSRCIRCYACREACPMCFCRDVCTMQTREPRWVSDEAVASQARMAQHIRVSHLAGRCTGCGECERACPAGIPLMLMLGEQNRAIEEMFGYRAGASMEQKPPLLTFDIKTDTWEKQ
ncbi:MAG: 4Fe-4S dicluster domain-containing protein [Thermoleophilia bacterium]|nr:4Fe-4S dicluster domain-containing protein [Thermoleophilia bacterium]